MSGRTTSLGVVEVHGICSSTESERLSRSRASSTTRWILIEHELRFVMDLADRVTVLDFGRKIAEGSPDEVRADPAVIEAYIGGALA